MERNETSNDMGFVAKATPNKSMDVRAKQRLSYGGFPLNLNCPLAVSPHVISAVRRLR